MVEALVIAMVVGLGLSLLAVQLFTRETADMNLPFWIAFAFDARVFAFVAASCLGTAVAFGLVPAWQLSKTHVHDVLKDGGRGAIGGRGARRWIGALLVGELALTLTLLGGASILVQSSVLLAARDTVLDLDGLVAAQIGLSQDRYDTPDKRQALHAQLQQRFDTSSAIPSATLSSVRPFVEWNTRTLEIEGEPLAGGPAPTVQTVGAGAHYFETLGVEMLTGRALRTDDGAPGRNAAVINQRFAQVHFPNVDPIGRRIRLTEPRSNAGSAEPWFMIVGVSPSIRQRTMASVTPLAYIPLDAHLVPTLAVIAQSGRNPAGTAAALREQVRAIDPDVAAYGITSLRRMSELSRWPARMVSLVLALFAVIASALSAAGLYGLTAYGVAQRTPEIGLRTALGAGRAQIIWVFLRSTLIHTSIGLALGLAGVLVVGRLISALLVETSGANALVLSGIVLALATIAAAACFGPTRRAVRLDPIVALRHD